MPDENGWLTWNELQEMGRGGFRILQEGLTKANPTDVVAAALTEVGLPEIARCIYTNRAFHPSFNYHSLDRLPTFVELLMVVVAFRLWYLRFAPDDLWLAQHEDQTPEETAANWLQLIKQNQGGSQ